MVGGHAAGYKCLEMATAAVPNSWGVLTRRERQVLALIAEGARNADIAARLVISESTAKTHVKNILRKLRAGNRTEAASIYLRAPDLHAPQARHFEPERGGWQDRVRPSTSFER